MSLIIKINFCSALYCKFLNNWISLGIRFKIERFGYETLFIWKKRLNFNFLFFFLESITRLKPIIGYYLFIINRNRKKLIKIHPYLLNENIRWRRSILWFCRSVQISTEFTLVSKVLSEVYNINFLNKSNALLYKIKHYTTISTYKTSKNYLW
jgi:hypothetical protein